jgi:competence protein ComEC
VLHKEIPFLRIGLPLCAGIISGLYFKPDPLILGLSAVMIMTGFLVSGFFNKYQVNHLFGFSLTISLYFLGFLLYYQEKSSISVLNSKRGIFFCTISDYPEPKENSYMLTVKLNSEISGKTTQSVEGSMMLYHKKDSLVSTFLPGDYLILKCTPVEITNRGNPYEFDYRFFMQNKGIKYYAFSSAKNILTHFRPRHRKLAHRALIVREKIIDMYRQRGITGDRLALVAAITLGQKNMLDPEQKQNFIKAGVMHIMAVSGLHAIILSLFVFNLLFFLRRRFNILRIIITILILWSFAFVTGLTPSVLRATLMFSFLQAGNLMKRRVNGINSVLASAFVLILIKPSVIFDAGFLLSYSAVIYIICFYQAFYTSLVFKNWLPDKIWQSASVTLVAQAGTLPLTIALFNRFPAYFIITNIIIVPLSSVLIITGCIIPMIFPVRFLSQFLALVLNYLTGLTELFTAKAASLPYSTIDGIGMTTPACILLTMTIFIFSYFFLYKKSISILVPVSGIILFVLYGTINEISIRSTNELIVYNTPGSSTIGIRTGKILNLFSDTLVVNQAVMRHCASLGLKIKSNELNNNYYSILAGNKQILICDTPETFGNNRNKPDIMIVTGKMTSFGNNVPHIMPAEVLIISSVTVPGSLKLNQAHNGSIDTIHYIRKSGAFTARL